MLVSVCLLDWQLPAVSTSDSPASIISCAQLDARTGKLCFGTSTPEAFSASSPGTSASKQASSAVPPAMCILPSGCELPGLGPQSPARLSLSRGRSPVTAVAWTRNGRQLLSASHGGEMLLFDVLSVRCSDTQLSTAVMECSSGGSHAAASRLSGLLRPGGVLSSASRLQGKAVLKVALGSAAVRRPAADRKSWITQNPEWNVDRSTAPLLLPTCAPAMSSEFSPIPHRR